MIKSKLLVITLVVLFTAFKANSQEFNKKLQQYSEEVSKELDLIDEARIPVLDSIAIYILKAKKDYDKTKLLFVCTHNSRRSHISQLWIETAAYFYGVDNVYSFSGGIETTAVNERAVDALKRAGFIIDVSRKNSENPYYIASQKLPDFPSYILYSKRYDDKQNPRSNFAAIMVCSDADESCPIVPGADVRFSVPYKDPRYSDNTPSETQVYDETVRLIAHEMFYIMKQVKKKEIIEAEKLK